MIISIASPLGALAFASLMSDEANGAIILDDAAIVPDANGLPGELLVKAQGRNGKSPSSSHSTSSPALRTIGKK